MIRNSIRSKGVSAVRAPRSLAVAAALASIVAATATVPAAPTAAGAPVLSRYAGKWVSDGVFSRTPYSKDSHVSGATTCGWSPMRNSLVCDQVVHTEAGEQRDTALYAYDAANNQYRFAEFPFDGAPPHITQLTIVGDTWSYVGGFTDNTTRVLFRTTDVFAGDLEKWRVEFSLDDGKKWIQMGAGKAKRIGN